MKVRRSNIDWPMRPLYTLNLAIGCKRNCFGGKCWARQMNNRFKWVKDFNKINYLGEWSDKIPGKDKYIWIGSMSDICFWESGFLRYIARKCDDYSQHQFLFLTKDPSVYNKIAFPENCWLGLTITGKESYDKLVQLYSDLTWGAEGFMRNKTFLSVEPLLGEIEETPGFIDQVIVGAMADGSVRPKKKWIESIKHDNIYWKKNIKKYL